MSRTISLSPVRSPLEYASGGQDFRRNLEGPGKIPVFFPPDPVNVRISPQPSQLALGVLPGAELHLRHGLLHRGGAVQNPQELLVSDGLESRGRSPRDSGLIWLLQKIKNS